MAKITSHEFSGIKTVSFALNKGRGRSILPLLPAGWLSKDICLNIHSEECVGMVGASGSGKSTLARLICLIDRQENGDVFFQGRNIVTLRRKAYYRKVQMVF